MRSVLSYAPEGGKDIEFLRSRAMQSTSLMSNMMILCWSCVLSLLIVAGTTAEATSTEGEKRCLPNVGKSVIVQADGGDILAEVNARDQILVGAMEDLRQWKDLAVSRIAMLEGQMAGLSTWIACTDNTCSFGDYEGGVKRIERASRKQLARAAKSLKADYKEAYDHLRECQEIGEKHLDHWLTILAALVGLLPIVVGLLQGLGFWWNARKVERRVEDAIKQSKSDAAEAILQLQRDAATTIHMSFSSLILTIDSMDRAKDDKSKVNFLFMLPNVIICYHHLLECTLKTHDAELLCNRINAFVPFAERWRNTGDDMRKTIWDNSCSVAQKAIFKNGGRWNREGFLEVLKVGSAEFLWLEAFYKELENAVR